MQTKCVYIHVDLDPFSFKDESRLESRLDWYWEISINKRGDLTLKTLDLDSVILQSNSLFSITDLSWSNGSTSKVRVGQVKTGLSMMVPELSFDKSQE